MPIGQVRTTTDEEVQIVEKATEPRQTIEPDGIRMVTGIRKVWTSG
jgi:hypothetical protein